MAVALISGASPALAAHRGVDRSFGSGGIARAEIEPHYEQLQFTAVTPQPDGGLLATRGWLSGGGAEVWRYQANGSVDPSFAPQPAPPRPEPQAVQEDGKTLKVKAECCPAGRLERHNPDGTPDATFGGAGTSEPVPLAIEQIVPLPSGKILVAGKAAYEYIRGAGTVYQAAVARFDPDGTVDSSFGAGGIVRFRSDHGLQATKPLGLVSRPGEEAAVVVTSPWLSEGDSFVAGLTSSGALDPNYGTTGLIRLGGPIVDFHALPEGRVALVANLRGRMLSCCERYESDLLLARYTVDGKADSAFGGGDGSETVEFGGIDLAHTVLWENDGSVLIGGSSAVGTISCAYFNTCPETPVLARFTPAGQPAMGFGVQGRLRLDALTGNSSSELGRGVLALGARPAGGTFAVGGSGTFAFLAALSPSGGLDHGFGSGGIVTERLPKPSTQFAEAISVDHRGRIFVAGRSDAGSTSPVPGGAVLRYRRNGSLDRSFGGGMGYVRVPAGANVIAVDRTGRSIVAWDELGTVSRITAAGKVDTGFGTEGMVRLGARLKQRLRVKSIAALRNGGALVAGEVEDEGSQRMIVARLRPNGSLDRSFAADGTAILGFGNGRPCGVRDLVIQPDGRILLAGFASVRGRAPWWAHLNPALMRLMPNGVPDRSFGRSARITPRFDGNGQATGVAVQGGKILVAGQARRSGQVTNLLLRYTDDGQLDRDFGRNGVARTPVKQSRRGGGLDEVQAVLPTQRRIVVVRAGSGRPVLAYRRDGRLERSFASAHDIASNRLVEWFYAPTPVAALQDGKVVMAWTAGERNEAGGLRPMIELLRLSSH